MYRSCIKCQVKKRKTMQKWLCWRKGRSYQFRNDN